MYGKTKQTFWYCIRYSRLQTIDSGCWPEAGQNGRHYADDICKRSFMNEKFCILFQISLKIVYKGSTCQEVGIGSVKEMGRRRTRSELMT